MSWMLVFLQKREKLVNLTGWENRPSLFYSKDTFFQLTYTQRWIIFTIPTRCYQETPSIA